LSKYLHFFVTTKATYSRCYQVIAEYFFLSGWTQSFKQYAEKMVEITDTRANIPRRNKETSHQ